MLKKNKLGGFLLIFSIILQYIMIILIIILFIVFLDFLNNFIKDLRYKDYCEFLINQMNYEKFFYEL
jgi:hypothetical protein